MSKTILLDTGWTFSKEGHEEPVTLPHTWNAVDGQDGGNDYYRGTCRYTRTLEKPELPDGGCAVLQFDGVAMTAVVSLNGEKVAELVFKVCAAESVALHLLDAGGVHAVAQQ